DRAADQAAPGRGNTVAVARARGRGAWWGSGLTATHSGQFGQALLHQVAEGAVGYLCQQRFGPLGQPALTLQRAQVDVAGQRVEEELRQWCGRRQALVETGRAFGPHDAVGILAVGQEQEERLATVLHP